ncbi:flavin-containing amine oxidoreductase-domain containing protein [Haematococcus lacustris]
MVELTASEAGFDEHGTSESIRPRTRGLPPVDYVSLVGKRSKKSNEYVPEPAPRPKEPRPQRRPRKNELSPDQLEAETARLVGLNPTQPEEEEQALLPPGVNENSYVKVRNHVLARWRADVTTHLSEEDAGQRILPKWQHLVSLAWRFLDLWGYINFGVAPALLQDPNPVPSQATIIVVGAGLAGAAAARQLCRWGYRVVVLEGRSRPGGRVWTLRMEEEGLAGMADLGGAIITGIDGNPLAVLARQLGLPMHRITDRCPLYLPGGEEAPKDLDDKVLAQHNALLDAADKYREELPGEVADNVSVGAALRMLWAEVPREPGAEDLHERLMHWHFANVEFANAAQLGTLSLRHWDQDDPYEMLGSHVFVPGGNLQLVGGLLQDVPVFYNTPVTSITHSRQGVTVNSQQAAFQADAVLVTVPLGVLKRNALRFSPPLSSAKQDAIHRLGFGVLNKLVMLFPHAFWDQGLDTLGQVAADPQDAGLFFLFYAYPPHLAGTGAILAALVSGASAQRFESVPVEQAVERVMAALRAAHEGKGVVVPDPLQAVGTRWAADPMCYGSYSSVAVGATGEDYDTLAMDVRGRLFFAGEATISKWPATMHGAFLSGLREAAKIRMAMERQQHMKRAGYMTRAQLASLADSDGEGDADLGGESDEDSPWKATPRPRELYCK